MEAALVTVATGVLKPVLVKLATLLGDEYKRFKGVRKEIRSLTHELAAMEAFLLKMSEEEDPDVQDNVWMNEVRELSYDMEDAIDDFMQSVGDKEEKPDGFIEKIKSSLGKLRNMKARRRIGKEIQDLKKQILEVGDRNARYKGRETVSKTANATVDPRALAIFEHASKLVGIDKPKAEIIKLLTEEDIHAPVQQQQPKIVSIVGSGGMGKTTLANQVYQELKGQYECRAFISVSRNPDMTNILRTILSEVRCQDYAHTEAGSIQQLISKITNYLAERRWIAEGFIHKEGRYTAYELGVRCFNELVNRSLIQPVKKDDYMGKSCRVHDIILDFIVSKSIEENFVTFVGVPGLTTVTQRKVRRLSMQVEGEGNSILPMSLILSHVRSVNVFVNKVNIHSMMEFRHLHVLDFNGNSRLENNHLANVGRLFQLRYLNIYMTAVSELPEQIGHLQCLEMLDIRYTKVSELPASIVNLGKLAHLLLGSEDTCVKFPDRIAKMQALETLDQVEVCKQSYNFLQGLGQLKNLRKLHIDYRDVAQEDKEVIASSLGNLCTQNLCSLTMWNDDDDFLLNTWCISPPLNLQKLVIWGCVFPKVPHWVGSLVNLQKLLLEVRRGIRHEDICILGALPALLTLGLEGMEKQPCEDRRLAVSGEAGFRCLRKFKYWRRGDWMDLMFTAKCMPKLEKLKIRFYRHAEDEAPIHPAFDFGIENLSSLTRFQCHLGGEPRSADAVKASLDRVVSAHPNPITLIFSY